VVLSVSLNFGPRFKDFFGVFASIGNGAILPARDMSFVSQGKFIMFCCFISYNKSFIDQACSVNMAGYWPRSFFSCLWTENKIGTWPISSRLDLRLGQ